jgi:hypothetical protein
MKIESPLLYFDIHHNQIWTHYRSLIIANKHIVSNDKSIIMDMFQI